MARPQPQNVYPQLRGEFRGAKLVYLPSVSLLRCQQFSGTVSLGTPVIEKFAGARIARLNDAAISFGAGSRELAFPNGFTVLAVGSYSTTSGINALTWRNETTETGGFSIELHNTFGTSNRIYGGVNVGGAGTDWGTVWVNGVKDTSNGAGGYTTATNTRYAVACASSGNTPASVSRDVHVGQGNGQPQTTGVELLVIWDRPFSEQQLRRMSADSNCIWQPPRRKRFLADSGVTAALTGVAGTGAVGTVAPSSSKALTGNAGTGAAGTVGVNLSKAITGNAAAGAVGSVTPVRAGAITGVAATATPGTVAPSAAKAITGNAATGSAGTVIPQASQTLTGTSGTGAAGALTPNVSIPIVGVSATGAAGTVTAETGGSAVSEALTGIAGTGSAGTVSPTLDKGLTGNAATGTVGSIAPAAAKALTGNAATGEAGAVSPSVTVALTGVSAAGAAGSVSVGADATQALTGVSGTGETGTVSPSITISLAGVSGTGAVGDLTAGQLLTGVEGAGSAGDVAPSSSKSLTGLAATGAAGTVNPGITISLSGVQASGEVGNVAFVSGDITIALTGVEAIGAVGVVSVAGEFSAIAAAVWAHVLSNGKTAGQNLVEIRSLLDLITPGFWDFVIEGTYTAADLLRVIAAVQAGKSTITALGGGAATVEFRAADDSETRVTATMDGSERTEVTLNVD